MKSQSLLSLLVLLSSCFMYAVSMAYIGLDMRIPKKCMAIDYPGTILGIVYDIFDPTKDRLAAGIKMPDLSQSSKVKLEVFPPDGSAIKRTKENHLEKIIDDTKGEVTYVTSGSGAIHICVEIQELEGRKYARPTMIGLRISESLPEIEMGRIEIDHKDQEKARNHLSGMERTLMGMLRSANLILKNADFIKEDEAAFYKQSEEMNAASKWWPMLHVMVLLVTGFTQANHIIKFFKGMHII